MKKIEVIFYADVDDDFMVKSNADFMKMYDAIEGVMPYRCYNFGYREIENKSSVSPNERKAYEHKDI